MREATQLAALRILASLVLLAVFFLVSSSAHALGGQYRGDGICAYGDNNLDWYPSYGAAISACQTKVDTPTAYPLIDNHGTFFQCDYNPHPSFNFIANSQVERKAWLLAYDDPLTFPTATCEVGGVPSSAGWIIVSVTFFPCVAGTTWNDTTRICEVDPVEEDCLLLGGDLIHAGIYGGYNSALDFPLQACEGGCIATYTGQGAVTYPYSNDPTSFYFEGQYNYAEGGFTCTGGQQATPAPTTAPAETSPPPSTDPLDPDYDGNGACPNNWHLQEDGSCSPTSDPSDPLNGGESNCDEGTYYATDLGICIGYNDPTPSNPNSTTSPTGGGIGNEAESGGTDGAGLAPTASGVDVDGDGQTQDEPLCVQFPQLDICKVSSHVDKGCESPPACSGDAIQCAIDRKLWSLNCSGGSGEVTESTNCAIPPVCSGDAIGCALIQNDFDQRCAWDTSGTTVTQATIDAALGTTETLDTFTTGTALDASDPTGGYVEANFGACPAPLVIPLTVIDTSINFSWAQICDYVDFIRIIVLLIAYFIAALIFYSAFFTSRGI